MVPEAQPLAQLSSLLVIKSVSVLQTSDPTPPVHKHLIELQLNSLLFEGDSEVSRQQHLTSIV